MAQVAILDHNQRDTDRPRCFRKRSAAKVLVARGLAYWVSTLVIRMIPREEIVARYLAAQTLKTPWESPEIPGLMFEDPMRNRHNPFAAIVRYDPAPVTA